MSTEVRIVEYACGHRLQDRPKLYLPDIRGVELQNFKASAEECIHDSKLDYDNKIPDHPDEFNKTIDDFEKICREKGITPIHHVDENEKPCGRGIASCRYDSPRWRCCQCGQANNIPKVFCWKSPSSKASPDGKVKIDCPQERCMGCDPPTQVFDLKMDDPSISFIEPQVDDDDEQGQVIYIPYSQQDLGRAENTVV